MKPRKNNTRHSKKKVHASSISGAAFLSSLDKRVPKRWVKFYIAVILLPFVWVLSKTFFGALAWVAIEHGVWNHPPFRIFTLSAAAFLLVFYLIPLPVRVYVFGHELTHALWVKLFGGKIGGIQVSDDGGYVLADRVNTWIALAPYFFPFYSAVWLSAFALAGLITDTKSLDWLFQAGLGVTWAYHLAYTCWMIPKGQSDLDYGGQFFSLVVIYIVNVLILAALLILSTPELSLLLFAHEFLQNAIDFSHWVVTGMRTIWQMLVSWMS